MCLISIIWGKTHLLTFCCDTFWGIRPLQYCVKLLNFIFCFLFTKYSGQKLTLFKFLQFFILLQKVSLSFAMSQMNWNPHFFDSFFSQTAWRETLSPEAEPKAKAKVLFWENPTHRTPPPKKNQKEGKDRIVLLSARRGVHVKNMANSMENPPCACRDTLSMFLLKRDGAKVDAQPHVFTKIAPYSERPLQMGLWRWLLLGGQPVHADRKVLPKDHGSPPIHDIHVQLVTFSNQHYVILCVCFRNHTQWNPRLYCITHH